jgi:16S rRNA (cytidine1402-2'-O)-methyltransferase
MSESGILYLVPTPVGNLRDMTYRAVEILSSVDLIACEDTRTSSRLLQHYDIHNRTTSYHAHNEHSKTERLIAELLSGLSIALVTDAGSPAISDPGFLLVREAVAEGITVSALPGPTAFVPALSASGLPSDRFVFEGFLPPKKGRMTRLRRLAEEDRTVILYEAPHRLEKLFKQLLETFGPGRRAVVARELSKKFETFHRGTIADLIDWIRSTEKIKGEMVVLIAPLSRKEATIGDSSGL